MEKSIETIWKEGFLNKNELLAPKVNDLYNKKSIHIIEKFENMFRMNIWGIVVVSTVLLVLGIFNGALIAGLIMWVMFLYVAYTAHHELKALEKVDKGQSSYLFLKSFKAWIDNSIDRYGKMYRVVYPVFVLTFYIGMWFSDSFADVRQQVGNSSDMVFGLHLHITLFVIAVATLLSIFSKAIHRLDVKSLYGGIINKLDIALAEMEELRG